MNSSERPSMGDTPRGPHKSKRPLFFISGEDFYFIAYSILLILELLGGGNKRVKDHRKIAYLIQFLGDPRLVDLLERTQNGRVSNPVDRELLFSSYANAELHKREVFKILFSMERRGYLKMQRTEKIEELDITLLGENLPKGFFRSDTFVDERTNAETLKRLLPRVSTWTFDTLLERLYRERGVNVWVS